MSEDRDKLAEVSDTISEVWNINQSTLDKHERDFMQAMKDMMMWLATNSGDTDSYNPLDSSYDSTDFLSAYSKAIDEYKEIFHIVNTSLGWKDKTL